MGHISGKSIRKIYGKVIPIYITIANADALFCLTSEHKSKPNSTLISISTSYEKLNSGSVAESLVELSGGVSQKILLTEDNSKAAARDGSLWKRLARSVA